MPDPITTALDDLTAATADLRRHAAAMRSAGATALSNGTQAARDADAVDAAIAALRTAITPAPKPAPPATLFGANPHASGKRPDVADLQAIVTRYKTGVAARIFDGTGALNPAPTHPDVARTHYSWKTDQISVTAGALDQDIATAIAPAAPGDAVEAIHEADVKGFDPAATLAFRQAWVRAVKSTRPDLVVPFTIGGWRFDPSDTKGGPDPWADNVHACDLLGVDLDGTPVKYPYRDYVPIIDAILTWMDHHQITRWAVPELAVKRAPEDPTGERRAEWITEQIGYMLALGVRAPEWICWFESSTVTDFAGTELTAQVERDALAAFI